MNKRISEAAARHLQDTKATYLRQVFDFICDAEDWKGPIDCLVQPGLVSDAKDAVEFMTATKAEAAMTDPITGLVRITSVGYRGGPAA